MGLFKHGFRNLRKNGQSKKHRFFKIKLFFSGILLTLVILLLLNQDIFRIKKIEIIMNGIDCASEKQINEILAIDNQNLLFLQTSKIAKKIQDKFYCISQVKIDKKFFGIVKVSLESRKPSVIINVMSFSKITENPDLQIATSSSQTAVITLSDFDLSGATQSGKFLADSSGFVYSEAEGDFKNLPSVDLVNSEVNMGRKIPGNLINTVIKILDELKKNSILAENAKILDTKILIYSEPKLIFSTEKDILRQVASLQLILQKARIDSRPIESVDLRFDKPVVKYFPKK